MEEVKNEGWGDVSQSYLKWFLHSPTEKKIDGVEFIIREFPALFLLHFLFLLVFCLYVFLKFSEISKSWLRLMVTSIVLHGHQPLRILFCFYFSCFWWYYIFYVCFQCVVPPCYFCTVLPSWILPGYLKQSTEFLWPNCARASSQL